MEKNIIRETIHNFGNIIRRLRIYFFRKAGIDIGKNCMISFQAKLDMRRGKIVIGDNVSITYGCVILSHDRASMILYPYKQSDGITIIDDDVFIGVNSVVLMGVKIGKGSIVGAGSVVVNDIPPYSIALGNPAKVVRSIPSKSYNPKLQPDFTDD